jgi:hypothetical protein
MGKRLKVRRHFSIAVEVVSEKKKFIRDCITKEKLGQHNPGDRECFSRDRNVGAPQYANCEIKGESDEYDSNPQKTEDKYLKEKGTHEADSSNRKNRSGKKMEFAKVYEFCGIF